MNQTEAARAVLIETANILGAFRENIVFVGGWAPELLYPGQNHVGSLDVDMAIGPEAVGDNAYTTILQRLIAKGYTHESGVARFYRDVPGASERVKVDLISGQYVSHFKTAAIRVDELRVNSLRGIDLAFEVFEEVSIEGRMPDGSTNVVRVRIPRPEAFILIKAFALDERAKEKDAYDIAFVLHNYEPSLTALAIALAPLIKNGLGAEAYGILKQKFAALESVGPSWAATVAEENGQDFYQAQQAAFQDATMLFDAMRGLQSQQGEPPSF